MLLANGLRAVRRRDGSVRITIGEGAARKQYTLCTGDQERLLEALREALGEAHADTTPASRSCASA